MKTILFAPLLVGTAMGFDCASVQASIDAVVMTQGDGLATQQQKETWKRSCELLKCAWSPDTYSCSGSLSEPSGNGSPGIDLGSFTLPPGFDGGSGSFGGGSESMKEFEQAMKCMNDAMKPTCTKCKSIFGVSDCDGEEAMGKIMDGFDKMDDVQLGQLCTTTGDVCLQALASFMGSVFDCMPANMFDSTKSSGVDMDFKPPTRAEMDSIFKMMCSKNQKGEYCLPVGEQIGDADDCAAMDNVGCCLGSFHKSMEIIGGQDLIDANEMLKKCNKTSPKPCAYPDDPKVEVIEMAGTFDKATTKTEDEIREILKIAAANKPNVEVEDILVDIDTTTGEYTIYVTPSVGTDAKSLESSLESVEFSAAPGVTVNAPAVTAKTESFEGNTAEVKTTPNGATTAHAFGFAALLVAILV